MKLDSGVCTCARGFALIVLLVMMLSGCGGGTIGTGDPGARSIRGTLLSVDGEPVPGITVAVEGREAAVVSDLRGQFALNIESAEAPALVLVQGERTTRVASFEVPDAGEGEEVNVAIEVDLASFTATIKEISISRLTPEPTPADEPDPQGEQASIIKGRVVTPSGPIAGVSLRVEGSATVSQTDSRGRFLLRVLDHSRVITLRIRVRGSTTSVRIRDLPDGPVLVEVELELSVESLTGGGGTTGGRRNIRAKLTSSRVRRR